MRQWSLGHLTVNGARPFELVEIAARAGYAAVDPLVGYIDVPGLAIVPLKAGDPDTVRMAGALKANGIALRIADGFVLDANSDLDSAKRTIDLVAGLGAIGVNTILFGDDLPAAVAKLAALDEIAAAAGLRTLMEPMMISSVHNPAQAMDVIAKTGSSNIRIMLDSLHFFYAGKKAADISQFVHAVGGVQLCDSPNKMTFDEYSRASIEERIAPGEGELPLREFMAALPRDLVCAIEVPRPTEPEMTDRARRVLEAGKRVDA